MRNWMVAMVCVVTASCAGPDGKVESEPTKTDAGFEPGTDGSVTDGEETLPDESRNNANADNTSNTGNYVEPDNRPYARLTPTAVDLGDVAVGDVVEAELEIASVGREPVTILAVRTVGDGLSVDAIDLAGTKLA